MVFSPRGTHPCQQPHREKRSFGVTPRATKNGSIPSRSKWPLRLHVRATVGLRRSFEKYLTRRNREGQRLRKGNAYVLYRWFSREVSLLACSPPRTQKRG